MKKRCSKCKVFKELQEFHRDARYHDGRQAECKECLKGRMNEKNKERREWRKMFLG